jgi:hypothetical protein
MPSILVINIFKSIHGKDMLTVDNYEYMLDKKRLRKHDENMVY